jgi:hypothetical protein
LQRSLKLLGATLRAELKSQFGYRWNSVIIGELMANGNAQLDAYTTEFNAFQAGEKTAWGTEDVSAPVTLTDGVPLYACASAIYDIGVRLGATLTLTAPAAANSATVGGEWTA